MGPRNSTICYPLHTIRLKRVPLTANQLRMDRYFQI